MGTESYSYIDNTRIQAAHLRLAKARKSAAESRVQPARWQQFYVNPWIHAGRIYWETLDAENPKPFGNTRYIYMSARRVNDQIRDTGFRFAGWSEDLIRLDHQGWYMDDEQGSVYGTVRGFVLQMPARDGKPRYFPAIYQSENCEVMAWPLECDDDPKEVARSADQYAERFAEDGRDWYQKDQAERRIEDLEEQIADERKNIQDFRMKRRSLYAAMRMLRSFRPQSAAITTLKEVITSLKNDAHKAFNSIEKMEKEIKSCKSA